MTIGKTGPLLCMKHRERLELIVLQESGALYACPVCGETWRLREESEKALKQPAGKLNEEMLADLREKIRLNKTPTSSSEHWRR